MEWSMTQYPVGIGIAVDSSTMWVMSGDNSLGVYTATAPFLPRQTLNQRGTNFITEEAKFITQTNQDKLRAEIAALKQELTEVKQRNAELEIIIDRMSQKSDAQTGLKYQISPMQIEIDQNKRSRQVSAITQTDFFQQLLSEIELLQA
jgi:hypothetical protein